MRPRTPIETVVVVKKPVILALSGPEPARAVPVEPARAVPVEPARAVPVEPARGEPVEPARGEPVEPVEPACPELVGGAERGHLTLSPAQRADRAIVTEVVNCDVRLSIVLSLASAGPANVGALSRRLTLKEDTVGRHLRLLKMRAFVTCEPRGNEHWYAATPDRVHLAREPDGSFALTLYARPGGVGVRVMVPAENATPSLATDGAHRRLGDNASAPAR